MRRVLVVGGGFGGVRCALDLDRYLEGRRDVEIILLDHNAWHTFLPSLYELATAYPPEVLKRELEETVAIPYTEIFGKTKVKFIQVHVTSLDLAGRQVHTNAGIYQADFLVLALGGVTNTFGIPGLAEHSISLRSLEDAFRIRQKVCAAVEKDDHLTIVIGGAGPTGVELACELRRFTLQLAQACGANPRNMSLILLEALHEILPGQRERVRRVVQQALKRCRIEIMTQCKIQEVRRDQVITDKKIFEANVVIWTGGVKAHSLVSCVEGVEKDKKGRLVVESTLELPTLRNIWVIGDSACVIPQGETKPWPELAYLAIDQGRVAAANLVARLEGKKLKKVVQSRPLVFVLPLGGARALYVGKYLVLDGYFGWLVNTLIALQYLLSILPWSRALTRWWHSFHL